MFSVDLSEFLFSDNYLHGIVGKLQTDPWLLDSVLVNLPQKILAVFCTMCFWTLRPQKLLLFIKKKMLHQKTLRLPEHCYIGEWRNQCFFKRPNRKIITCFIFLFKKYFITIIMVVDLNLSHQKLLPDFQTRVSCLMG